MKIELYIIGWKSLSLLTIGNQSHGQAADDLQDANGATIPFRGNLHSEQGGEREYFGILHVLCALQSRGKLNMQGYN